MPQGGTAPVLIKTGPSFSSLIAKSPFFTPFEGFLVAPVVASFAISPFFAIPFSASLSGWGLRVFGNLDIDEAAVHFEFGKGSQDQVGELCIRIEKGETVFGVHIVDVLLVEAQGVPEEVLEVHPVIADRKSVV